MDALANNDGLNDQDVGDAGRDATCCSNHSADNGNVLISAWSTDDKVVTPPFNRG